jgi:isopropylmalate/homocitrate/citramalate synthase
MTVNSNVDSVYIMDPAFPCTNIEYAAETCRAAIMLVSSTYFHVCATIGRFVTAQ